MKYHFFSTNMTEVTETDVQKNQQQKKSVYDT